MDTSPGLVLGMDIGGTASRALVADTQGDVHGTGRAEGGNPNSHAVDTALRHIGDAIRTALADTPATAIRAVVIGLAGSSVLSQPRVAEQFDRTWAELGLRCPVHVRTDYEIAFAAGTPAAHGTALIAGTGAVAARIEQHRAVRTVDGHGWLLGDDGSGFWLGREAVRATLRCLDQQAQPGPLARAVLERLIDPSRAHDHDELISAVHARPPIRLAELAPLVTAAVDEDPAARDIAQRAGAVLARTATKAAAPGTTELVLAGGLVDPGNPVGSALRTELAEQGWPEPHVAGSGAGAAAWLATRELLDQRTEPRSARGAELTHLHTRLTEHAHQPASPG